MQPTKDQSSSVVTGSILLARVAKIEALTLKCNKKLEKRGLEPISLEYGEKGERVVEIKGFEYCLDTIEVVITGHLPSIPGYKLHGIQMSRDGLPLYIGNIPDEYKDIEKPHCDHCQTKRKRSQYAVIENTENGEIMIVGSSCYRDFFSKKDGDDILAYANIFRIISFEADDGDSLGGGSPLAVYCPLRFLAVVNNYIRLNDTGFVSAMQADIDSVLPTWFAAKKRYHKAELSEGDLAEAKAIFAHINSLDSMSSYLSNVKVRINAECIGEKDCAFVASA